MSPSDLPFNPRKRHVYRDAAWVLERPVFGYAAWFLEHSTLTLERQLSRIPLWLAVLRWLAR